MNIPGYYIDNDLRKDRTDTLRGIGGGLLVYVRDGLTVKPKEYNNDLNQFSSFEVIGENKNVSKNISLVYRSPNSTEQNTENLCKFIAEHERNFLALGDFNLPNIDWNLGTSNRKGAKFLKTIEDNFISQLIDCSSHIHGNILDLALTDKPEEIVDIMDIGCLSNSDHTSYLVEVMFEPQFNQSKELILDWKNADNYGLMNFFSEQKWNDLFQDKAVEECWDTFSNTVNAGIERFVPKIPRRRRGRPPWMTRTVLKICRKKQRLWKAYMESRSQTDHEQFKKQEKLAKKSVNSAKRSYEKKISKDGNKRPFNAYIKSKTKSRSPVGPLKVGSNSISDNKEMARILNDYFCTVFTKENNLNIPVATADDFLSPIQTVIFERRTVEEKIMQLKPGSAPGPDGITTRILQDYVKPLSIPLTQLFNLSMRSGGVPEMWKHANVTPIFKKGSKSKPENYRPVSLTSIPCKIMESIIKDHIVDHLMNNFLIRPTQHGFMKQKSCLTNLLSFLEILTSEHDNGCPMDIIFLDFAKAFDKVPRLRLLEKIRSHGITGNLLQWIDHWLSGRKQRVVINGEHSDWDDVLSGVPQGSVLGPLAFIIFINDIDLVAELIKIILKFADDTKLGHTILTDQDRLALQQCLDNLVAWAEAWGMQFNIDKCKVMHIGRTNPTHKYYMGGVELTTVEKEKDIGVLMHRTIKPSLQCAESARLANVILGQIARSFHYRDRFTFLNLYKQYVRCHMEFSVSAWSPWSEADKEVLEKVQRRAVSMISGLKGRTYNEKLSELSLMSLEQRRIRYDMIETYKILNGFTSADPSIWFNCIPATARQTRNTAGYMNLERLQARTQIRENFFSVRVPPVWNSLPDEVKKSTSISAFKRQYDAWANLNVT